MTRPALSAARTTAIIDLLTAYPERTFTISEIVRATQINLASCHAVLAALTKAGYLAKTNKAYVIGPTLLAVGQAALKSHPLVNRALQASEDLASDLRVPVMLTTLREEDVVVLSSIADAAGRTAGLRTGQRRQIIPYTCLVFVAWSPEGVLEEWIAKAALVPAEAEEWRRTVRLIRQRGYQLILREGEDYPLSELMADMAAWDQASEYKDNSMGLLERRGQRMFQPEALVAEERYEVAMIAAPIFDRGKQAELSLCLGGFAEKLTGAQIEDYAKRVVGASLNVMRSHRAQSRAI